MDSSTDPQAFDDNQPEVPRAGAADTGAEAPVETGASRAVTRFEAKAVGESRSEADKPASAHSAPVQSSALVILPPTADKRERFADSFTAGERPGGVSRARRPSWLGYLLRAAAVVVVAGGAYAVGRSYLSWPALPTPSLPHAASLTPTTVPAVPAAAKATPEQGLADLRHENKVLRDEVRKLQQRLAALQPGSAPDDIRSLKKTIESLQASLNAEQTDFKAQIAQLTARLDHVHEASRVSAVAKTGTARIDAKAIQATLDRAARDEAVGGPHAEHLHVLTLASAEGARHTPQLLSDWVVRDVYRGIALVEGPQGAVEVVPGDVLPGAGTVRAIERRGDGWIVITSRGFVDYDHD
jgi:hypothetical protein